MRKVIVHGAWLLAVAASVAGCAPVVATSASGGSTQDWSASVLPLGAGSRCVHPVHPVRPVAPTPWACSRFRPARIRGRATRTPHEPLRLHRHVLHRIRPGPGKVAVHPAGIRVRRNRRVDQPRRLPAADRHCPLRHRDRCHQRVRRSHQYSRPRNRRPGRWSPTLPTARWARPIRNRTPYGNDLVDIAGRVGDYLVDVHEFTAGIPDPAPPRPCSCSRSRRSRTRPERKCKA